MKKRSLAPLAAIAAIALASGCGGDGEDAGEEGAATSTAPAQAQETGSAPPPASADDPAAAFTSFQAALAEGDAGTACGLLADSAVQQVEEASIGGSCEDWVEEFSGVFTDEIRDELRSIEPGEVTERGDEATVEYTSPILDLPLEARLERTPEGWRLSELAEGV